MTFAFLQQHCQLVPNLKTTATEATMPAVLESSIVTEVPGPLSKAACKKLDSFFDARAVHFVVDYDKSSGT